MKDKRLFAIRGATTSENTAESIRLAVEEMCREIFMLNSVKAQDIVSVQFTMTPDLDELNPATALRKSDTGLDTSKIALFAMPELYIKGMPPKTIRVLVTTYLDCDAAVKPVYLNGAKSLRPEFALGN